MRFSLSLLFVLFLAAFSLPAAPVYGVHSEPFQWTYSASPFTSTTISTANRTDIARSSADSLGVQIAVTNFAGPANVVEALRYEILTVAAMGPIQPTWVVDVLFDLAGTYSLGPQSLGSIAGHFSIGGTLGPGGIAQPASTTTLFGQSFGENTNGAFHFVGTSQTPVPLTGSITVGLRLRATAQNNGFVSTLNSLHFGGARVIDSTTGLAVAGATITSESGFDWTAPVPASTPEPGTLALTGGALGCLLLLKRL